MKIGKFGPAGRGGKNIQRTGRVVRRALFWNQKNSCTNGGGKRGFKDQTMIKLRKKEKKRTLGRGGCQFNAKQSRGGSGG